MPKVEFPFPFTDFESFHEDGDRALTVRCYALFRRTTSDQITIVPELVDLRMIELSYALRGKPSWWTKIKDPVIRSKWKAEALEHEIQGDRLKEAEIEWVLDELEDYTNMRDEATGIQLRMLRN